MATLIDLVDTMEVSVHTPDETAYASVTGRGESIRVWFYPGYFAHVSQRQAVAKLEKVGALLWVAWQREYYRLMSGATNVYLFRPPQPTTPAEAAVHERKEQHRVRMLSPDGHVAVVATGLLRWQVEVLTPGLDEETLTDAVGRAATDAVQQHLGDTNLFRPRRFVD